MPVKIGQQVSYKTPSGALRSGKYLRDSGKRAVIMVDGKERFAPKDKLFHRKVTKKPTKIEKAIKANKGKPVKKKPAVKKKGESLGQQNLNLLLRLGDLSDKISQEADKKRIITRVSVDDPRILVQTRFFSSFSPPNRVREEYYLQLRKKPVTGGEFVKWVYMRGGGSNMKDPITKEMRDMAKKEYKEFTKDKQKLVFVYDLNTEYRKDKYWDISNDGLKIIEVDKDGDPTAQNFQPRRSHISGMPPNYYDAKRAFFKAGDLGYVAQSSFDYLRRSKKDTDWE